VKLLVCVFLLVGVAAEPLLPESASTAMAGVVDSFHSMEHTLLVSLASDVLRSAPVQHRLLGLHSVGEVVREVCKRGGGECSTCSTPVFAEKEQDSGVEISDSGSETAIKFRIVSDCSQTHDNENDLVKVFVDGAVNLRLTSAGISNVTIDFLDASVKHSDKDMIEDHTALVQSLATFGPAQKLANFISSHLTDSHFLSKLSKSLGHFNGEEFIQHMVKTEQGPPVPEEEPETASEPEMPAIPGLTDDAANEEDSSTASVGLNLCLLFVAFILAHGI
jgi:hypothetical protein